MHDLTPAQWERVPRVLDVLAAEGGVDPDDLAACREMVEIAGGAVNDGRKDESMTPTRFDYSYTFDAATGVHTCTLRDGTGGPVVAVGRAASSDGARRDALARVPS